MFNFDAIQFHPTPDSSQNVNDLHKKLENTIN